MGWLASFKGLRRVGVPPVIAGAVLVGLFLLFRNNTEESSLPEVAAA